MKFLSQVYTAVSGSIGGVTYSRNKGGMYTRGRATPTNPNTVKQQEARTRLAMTAALWNDLDEADRDLWRAYAETQNHLNKLGQTILWSGQQEFSAANSLLLGCNQATVSVPPLILTKPEFEVTGFDLDDAQIVGLTTNALPVEAQSIFDTFSRPISPGVNFFKGPFCANAVIIAAGAGGTTFAGLSTFPAAEDQVIWGKFTLVKHDGRYSASKILSTVVVAA